MRYAGVLMCFATGKLRNAIKQKIIRLLFSEQLAGLESHLNKITDSYSFEQNTVAL